MIQIFRSCFLTAKSSRSKERMGQKRPRRRRFSLALHANSSTLRQRDIEKWIGAAVLQRAFLLPTKLLDKLTFMALQMPLRVDEQLLPHAEQLPETTSSHSNRPLNRFALSYFRFLPCIPEIGQYTLYWKFEILETINAGYRTDEDHDCSKPLHRHIDVEKRQKPRCRPHKKAMQQVG